MGASFDWESRSGRIAAGTPLITVVPYAYEAFEAGYEATGALRYLDTMESIARFAHREIPVTELEGRAAAAAYSPFDRTRVVNASAYRAYLLASAGRRFERDGWSGEAERNVAFVLDSQRPDGSWSYADASEDFVDNFHTCLVLKNLVKVWRIKGCPDAVAAVCRGFAFYRRTCWTKVFSRSRSPYARASRSTSAIFTTTPKASTSPGSCSASTGGRVGS